MKFLFLSRHKLSADQIADLTKRGFTEFIEVNPVVLDASTCAQVIMDLSARYQADAIGLVAPGRVWVALSHTMQKLTAIRRPGLYEAESRQAPELRHGDGPIPFVHVAWHLVVPGARPCQCGSGKHWMDCIANTPCCG